MSYLYQFSVLGSPSADVETELRDAISNHLALFDLAIGREVEWVTSQENLGSNQRAYSAAIFFGSEDHGSSDLQPLLRRGIPILPVASAPEAVAAQIPEQLRPLNCIFLSDGIDRIAIALLECAGLLPRRRRVFLSYRRAEASNVALQLFDALSARLFDVFLDTHEIAPGEDFQTMLWHRLCDSDVLIMLDTETYFQSRWTAAEYGRALAKNISVLRIGWPDSTPSARTATASRAELLADELTDSGLLVGSAVQRICAQLEHVRSESLAVRTVNMTSSLRAAVEQIGGAFLGAGPRRSLHLRLPNDRTLTVYPNTGVPTSSSLHDAEAFTGDGQSAVLYDHIGISPRWLDHLTWLGKNVTASRWLRTTEASWQLADWEN